MGACCVFSRLNGGLRFLNADFCQYCVGNVSWPWWRTDKPATNEHIWADDENHFKIRVPTFEPLCLLGCLWAISETRLRISNPFQFKTWGHVASDLESHHQRNLPAAAFKSAPLEHPNEVVLANMWNIILPSKWISQGLLQSGVATAPPHVKQPRHGQCWQEYWTLCWTRCWTTYYLQCWCWTPLMYRISTSGCNPDNAHCILLLGERIMHNTRSPPPLCNSTAHESSVSRPAQTGGRHHIT